MNDEVILQQFQAVNAKIDDSNKTLGAKIDQGISGLYKELKNCQEKRQGPGGCLERLSDVEKCLEVKDAVDKVKEGVAEKKEDLAIDWNKRLRTAGLIMAGSAIAFIVKWLYTIFIGHPMPMP
jgi:hypothetical protein